MLCERMLRDLLHGITEVVERSGLMARVFGRVKSDLSIDGKMTRKGYAVGARLMQDLIGIRAAVYFVDDLPVLRDLLVRTYGEPVDEVQDHPDHDTFAPIRWNLVFPVPPAMQAEIRHAIGGRPIDETFEVQLRSVLAEGWHEVEHDLRYKAPENWADSPDMSRMFNGILASLETADWSLLQLFERLAYQKYKTKHWEGMLRMKYRLRMGGKMSARLSELLDADHELAKKMFRGKRSTLISHLYQLPSLPLTVDNILLLANRVGPRNEELIESEPMPVRRMLDMLFNVHEPEVSGTYPLYSQDN